MIAADSTIHDIPNSYDNGGSGVYNLSSIDFGNGGVVDWYAAQAYVSYLNSINYGNSNQWVLSTISDVTSNIGYNLSSGQLASVAAINGRDCERINLLVINYLVFISPIFGQKRLIFIRFQQSNRFK